MLCGSLPADVFVPEVGMLSNEASHQFDAVRVVEHAHAHAIAGEQVLRALKVAVLPDHHTRDAEQQARSRAHDARAESADERELRPVTAASGVANRHHLSVRRGIAGLHPQVVATRHNATGRVGQHRADRQTALLQAEFRLGKSFAQKLSLIHDAYACEEISTAASKAPSTRCYCPSISGSPFLLLPTTTTFVFGLRAKDSVASIPFHSSSAGLIPWDTICWKSWIPCASMRLRSASCFSFCSLKLIASDSCSACCLAWIACWTEGGSWM